MSGSGRLFAEWKRFGGADALRRALEERGVSVRLWGGHKGVDVLAEELRLGECRLQLEPVVERIVDVVAVRIRRAEESPDRQSRELLEATQTVVQQSSVSLSQQQSSSLSQQQSPSLSLSPNAIRRERMRPLSEKRRAGEAPWVAAARGVDEELAGLPVTLDLWAGPVAVWCTPVAESPSYPSLPSRYRMVLFDAAAHGLPPHDFDTHEYETTQNNTQPHTALLVHHWVWRPRAPLASWLPPHTPHSTAHSPDGLSALLADEQR
eukprot:TRINITY_DN2008_c0_g4_i2.p1 TRINITY_DN2008_c0_g4~~TRINITY_DN2008_c0_g4_i2.p1  ORF type:complete len:264 (-),score=40.67 TRINITY_DN2008_c0_g4_i2:1674-2465(-)